MFDQYKPFTKLTVSGNYSASETSILISGSDLASRIPASGSGIFSVVWYNHTDYPAVYNDPNKEICRVTGFSGQTLSVSRGREYTSPAIHSGDNKTFKMIATPTARGFNNLYYFRNPEKSYYVFDDMMGRPGNANGWVINTYGGVGSNMAATFPQQMGVWYFANGDSVGNYRFHTLGTDAYTLSGGLTVFETLINIDKIPSGGNAFNFLFGFLDNHTLTSVANGAWFTINSGSSGYRCFTASAGTQSYVNSAVNFTTGWHKYNIVINASGTNADFYVDDIQVGNLTTTIPASTTTDIKIVANREAVSDPAGQPNGTGYMDYVLVYKEIEASTASYGATGYNFRL